MSATIKDEVLALLRARPEGVTSFDALREVGSMRLAARVLDLRHDGYDIEADTVKVRARNGRIARVARYRLVLG